MSGKSHPFAHSHRSPRYQRRHRLIKYAIRGTLIRYARRYKLTLLPIDVDRIERRIADGVVKWNWRMMSIRVIDVNFDRGHHIRWSAAYSGTEAVTWPEDKPIFLDGKLLSQDDLTELTENWNPALEREVREAEQLWWEKLKHRSKHEQKILRSMEKLYEVTHTCKYYVYALIDPWSHKPFYIGKGCGKRVLSHVKDVLRERSKSEVNRAKTERIRYILTRGRQPVHRILHSTDDEREALHMEYLMIERWKGQLTNVAPGQPQYARAS